MDDQRFQKDRLLNSLPPEWPQDLRPAIQEQIKSDDRKVVVLDDDPTGTQTVHGLPVLTEWSLEMLAAELQNDLPAFYILTNSRSLPLPDAQTLNAEIGCNLSAAAAQVRRGFVVISRSDSTLRGHFPGEVAALSEALDQNFNAWIINPFFLEGGRYTVEDVHYVDESGMLVPAAHTEFARDRIFGYASSNLRDWVAEKTGGQKISQGLIDIMQCIQTRPRYILAKGGITASDIATRALNVKKAMVLGQILPGVPVWQLGEGSRLAGLPYIVFPGNVGDDQYLTDVAQQLKQSC